MINYKKKHLSSVFCELGSSLEITIHRRITNSICTEFSNTDIKSFTVCKWNPISLVSKCQWYFFASNLLIKWQSRFLSISKCLCSYQKMYTCLMFHKPATYTLLQEFNLGYFTSVFIATSLSTSTAVFLLQNRNNIVRLKKLCMVTLFF